MTHSIGTKTRSQQKAVLVTGGAGYIGSHTCKALAQAGYLPVAYDNLSIGHAASAKWGPLVVADISDCTTLAETLNRYNFSAVIHFAASAYVGESVENPRKYFNNNVGNTLKMLDCLLDRGLTNVIFSSSCATYGSPAMVPISESHAQTPVNPYGESKLVIEKALYWYGLSHGLSWVALRYFNAAGADPGGEVGESHDVETHLIPLAIRAALTPDFQFSLFGADYPTPDGTAIRDFIHVSDLASAHVLALKYLEDGKPSRAFNLGTGQGYSVSEIVANIEAITGRRVNLQVLPRRPGDPAELRADPRAAIEELHWTAKHSSVSEIISTAWQWAVRHATPEPETQVAPQIIPAGMSSAAGHLGLQPVS